MFYLQDYCSMTGQWERSEGEEFDNVLEALEKRDAKEASWPNDGVSRGVRAVDEDGNILEYGKREVDA